MRKTEIQYRQADQKDKAMKIENLPMYILLVFTAVYMVFAKNTPVWNGLFFVSNYTILSILFYGRKNKHVRYLGTALSLSIILFSVLKFFISLDQQYLDYLNIVIFILIAISFYKPGPK